MDSPQRHHAANWPNLAGTMTPIITPHELLLLQQTRDFVLIDARAGADAAQKHERQHLEGALFVDLERDLAAPTDRPQEGGRHPLPPVERFAQTLGRLGITPTSHVIVYDDKAGANAAARFWWMLKAVGHKAVQVVEGGFDAAVAAGYPTRYGAVPPSAAAPYPVSGWQLPVATIEEVEKAAADPAYLVIDVRDAYRYRGESEPIDPVAGHIPGAVNIPFASNLNELGDFREPGQLRKQYEKALGTHSADHVIVHCGSGVTACHTALAMAYAGMEIPKLYVGSWGEWCRTERPIARGEA